MVSAVNDQIRTLLLRSSGVVIFLLLWELAPRLEWLDPYFVPPLTVVTGEAGTLLREGSLPIHLLVSVWRAIVGLLVATAVGLPLGFLLARRFQQLAEAIDPILRILSQVNPFTLLPVFMLFFGIGETAKVAVVGWVSLWPILFYSITAAREVDPVQIKTAASMGITPWDMLLKVIVPGALPTTFVGIRIAASLTFYILIAAEMLGAGAGLGWLVHNSAMNYLIPRIYAGAVCIVLLGFLLNRVLLWLERVLFVWREEIAIFPGEAAAAVSTWRPGRFAVRALAAVVVAVLLFGGIEVQRINREAANPSGSHSRHFGTPVDSGGSSY
jgi:NitT/TauT family transport system permease protein